MEVIRVHPKTKPIRQRLKGAKGSGYRAISWEQQREGVLVDILGKLVQDILELGGDINPLLFEGVEHGHQNSSGMSDRVGLGTKGGLTGDDRRSKVPLGKVVFRRYG